MELWKSYPTQQVQDFAAVNTMYNYHDSLQASHGGNKAVSKKINGKGITSHIENNECLFSAHLPGKSSKDHCMGHERVSIQQTLAFVQTHHGNPKH